jgi:hypothetical protein
MKPPRVIAHRQTGGVANLLNVPAFALNCKK